MEWLIGIFAFLVFIVWLIWNGGWNSGWQSGLQEAGRKNREINGNYERQITELKKDNQSQAAELRTLKSAIRDANAHLDALRGDAVQLLEAVRSTKPPRLLYPEAFLLLAPGVLRAYAEWARDAGSLWLRIDQLSLQSRRALEEATLAFREIGTSDVQNHSGDTPLLREVISVLRERPPELGLNLFDFSSYDFDELSQWFDTLARFSSAYVVRVSEVEDEMRREKARSATIDLTERASPTGEQPEVAARD